MEKHCVANAKSRDRYPVSAPKYQIYQVTNKINNKIYIGKHECKCKSCNYFGSGKLIKKAIDKYGIDNFVKTILFVFDNEQDMNEKERELVTEAFCSLKNNYNICEGGKGGFGYINNSPELKEKVLLKNRQVRRKTDKILKRKYGKNFRSVMGKKGVRALKLKHPDHFKKMKIASDKSCPEGTFKGKKHTLKTIQKMRIAARGRQEGSKNSQYGTIWINNGMVAKKIKKDYPIPKGYRLGRKIVSAVVV